MTHHICGGISLNFITKDGQIDKLDAWVKIQHWWRQLDTFLTQLGKQVLDNIAVDDCIIMTNNYTGSTFIFPPLPLLGRIAFRDQVLLFKSSSATQIDNLLLSTPQYLHMALLANLACHLIEFIVILVRFCTRSIRVSKGVL